jgi:hypothetical protein
VKQGAGFKAHPSLFQLRGSSWPAQTLIKVPSLPGAGSARAANHKPNPPLTLEITLEHLLSQLLSMSGRFFLDTAQALER